ncbi:MAG: hypothetical protein IPI35_32865 [Deltaproteobacteria bacterium]|nr:hypothetical protein [Deltaproteobacteria bacterium]
MFTRISLPSLLVTLSLTACATSNKQSSPEEITPGAPVETTEVYDEAQEAPALAEATVAQRRRARTTPRPPPLSPPASKTSTTT